MERSQYKAKRAVLLTKFSSLGLRGVSAAFRLVKESDDPTADAVRYAAQLEEMTDELHNARAAQNARDAQKRRF